MAKPLVTDDGWVEAVKNSWGTKKAKGPKSYQTTKQLNRKEFARCIRELEQLLMPEQVGKVGQSEVLSEAVDFLTKLGTDYDSERAVMEVFEGVLMVVDMDGVIKYVSDSCEGYLDYKAMNMRERNLMEFVFWKDVMPLRTALMQLNLHDVESWSGKIRLRKRDDAYIQMTLTGRRADQDGATVQLLTFYPDDFWGTHSVVPKANVMPNPPQLDTPSYKWWFLHSLDGGFDAVFPGCKEGLVYGYKAAELEGKKPYHFMHPNDVGKVGHVHKVVAHQQYTGLFSARIFNARGTWERIKVLIRPCVNARTGRLEYLQCHGVTMTSDEEDVLEVIPNGALVIDPSLHKNELALISQQSRQQHMEMSRQQECLQEQLILLEHQRLLAAMNPARTGSAGKSHITGAFSFTLAPDRPPPSNITVTREGELFAHLDTFPSQGLTGPADPSVVGEPQLPAHSPDPATTPTGPTFSLPPLLAVQDTERTGEGPPLSAFETASPTSVSSTGEEGGQGQLSPGLELGLEHFELDSMDNLDFLDWHMHSHSML
eukprot:comp22591_c1_seq1/m.34608 comp22591_c1_seq1/g.34608  ORF comp22591_c1_seq1/g.34608 comp22591_c1_seq1/m.34608 type:complete len:542 (-) comp22591_c1_seq1:434-2059(-)